VQRWLREYPIVVGGFAFDRTGNPLAEEWPLYREAHARGAPYVLRLGEVPTSAT